MYIFTHVYTRIQISSMTEYSMKCDEFDNKAIFIL